jgi:Ca2+-binding RTX toxin-like protein
LGCDTLAGGVGNDVVQGDGNDRFVFTSKVAGDRDRVTDFTEGDLLAFQGSTFTALGAAGPLNAEAFAQHVSYDASLGTLYYDADGSGFGAKVLVGVITNHAALDVGDFWVA